MSVTVSEEYLQHLQRRAAKATAVQNAQIHTNQLLCAIATAEQQWPQTLKTVKICRAFDDIRREIARVIQEEANKNFLGNTEGVDT